MNCIGAAMGCMCTSRETATLHAERDALRADLEQERKEKESWRMLAERTNAGRDSLRADLDAARAELEAAKSAAWETGYATGLENGRAEQQSDLDAAMKLLERWYEWRWGGRPNLPSPSDDTRAFLARKRGG